MACDEQNESNANVCIHLAERARAAVHCLETRARRLAIQLIEGTFMIRNQAILIDCCATSAATILLHLRSLAGWLASCAQQT